MRALKSVYRYRILFSVAEPRRFQHGFRLVSTGVNRCQPVSSGFKWFQLVTTGFDLYRPTSRPLSTASMRRKVLRRPTKAAAASSSESVIWRSGLHTRAAHRHASSS